MRREVFLSISGRTRTEFERFFNSCLEFSRHFELLSFERSWRKSGGGGTDKTWSGGLVWFFTLGKSARDSATAV